MDYFSILNLSREPFSNSPDPDYFFQSQEHLDCLQKLELSLHLRRGLNVILGEVGTGKTTLCRQLIRKFAPRKEMETHLILDPLFKDTTDFLVTVAKLLCGRKPAETATDWQIKEFIKHSLFRKGVDQKKTVILIIDEGQKLPGFCLEALREFLNYETNAYKLLQIVIFAQQEFEIAIRRQPNFADRINLYHRLGPLSFADTRKMIQFRLEKSSSSPQPLDLFTWPALRAIYRISGGYPRKIIHICHHSLLAMIIQDSRKIGYRLVRRCAQRLFPVQHGAYRPSVVLGSLALGALMAIGLWYAVPHLKTLPGGDRPTPADAGAAVPSPAAPSSKPAAAETDAPAAPENGRPPPAPQPAAPAALPAAALDSPGPDAARSDRPPAETPDRAAQAPGLPSADWGPGPQPPPILGRVALRPNETLSGLIHRVYGQYSNRHFRFVVMANPLIEDPDRVIAGEPIVLPAIPVPVKPLNKEAWWVKIRETSSLEEGVEALRGYPTSAPAVRLIPAWHPQTGLRFLVIAKTIFFSENAAQSLLDRMPPPYREGGRVERSWKDPAVFFADPFYVK